MQLRENVWKFSAVPFESAKLRVSRGQALRFERAPRGYVELQSVSGQKCRHPHTGGRLILFAFQKKSATVNSVCIQRREMPKFIGC